MKRLYYYTIAGIIFTFIAGTISHFVYEWSGNNFILGYLFPVSESTWEHMKLCFFPMLFYSLFMNAKLKAYYPCITSALSFGILLGTFLIPMIFYTYSGILGQNFLSLDIATFALSVLTGFCAVYRLSLSCRAKPYETITKLLVSVLTICFFLFTYHTSDLGIFRVPG